LEQLLKDYDEQRIETAEILKKLDELAKQINQEEHSEEQLGLNRNAKTFYKLIDEYITDGNLSEDDRKEKASEIDEIFVNDPNACYEWQKKEDSIRELKKRVKRATIGVVDDKESFTNKVIEYAKVNYYKG